MTHAAPHNYEGQLVTNCDQLKTGYLYVSQPVTTRHQFKPSPNSRNLISLP